MMEVPAGYVDPLLPRTSNIVPLSKPFGYQYLKEYHFYWVPEPMQTILDYQDFSMGSLEDIAELIAL